MSKKEGKLSYSEFKQTDINRIKEARAKARGIFISNEELAKVLNPTYTASDVGNAFINIAKLHILPENSELDKSPLVSVLTDSLLDSSDRANLNYLNKCEQWKENGEQGGRPPIINSLTDERKEELSISYNSLATQFPKDKITDPEKAKVAFFKLNPTDEEFKKMTIQLQTELQTWNEYESTQRIYIPCFHNWLNRKSWRPLI